MGPYSIFWIINWWNTFQKEVNLKVNVKMEDSWVLCHSWKDSKFASPFTTSHAIFKKKDAPSLHFIPPPPPWRSIEQISVDTKQNNSKDLVSLFYSKQKEAELKSWIKHFKMLNRAFARILCGRCPSLFHRCKRHCGKSGSNNTISWNLKTELETIPNVYVIHHDVSSVHFALCFSITASPPQSWRIGDNDEDFRPFDRANSRPLSHTNMRSGSELTSSQTFASRCHK